MELVDIAVKVFVPSPPFPHQRKTKIFTARLLYIFSNWGVLCMIKVSINRRERELSRPLLRKGACLQDLEGIGCIVRVSSPRPIFSFLNID